MIAAPATSASPAETEQIEPVPLVVSLPWPSSRLSSNGPHGSWAAKHRARKDARYAAKLMTWARCLNWAKKNKRKFLPAHKPVLIWTFHPPDKRRRDTRNVIDRLKAAEDGISDALKIDDSRFRNRWPEDFAEVKKGGEIVITILEMGSDE